MPPREPEHLKPRKQPRQARAVATVEAIYEAAIQVLLTRDASQFTTTQVAERAGVSVGTLYQYFPHRRALLHALSRHYLGRVADQVEAVCAAHHGAPPDRMVEALVGAYWDAKIDRNDVARAVYRSAVAFDSAALMAGFRDRLTTATRSMLQSAPGLTETGEEAISTTLLPVIFGTVREMCEQDPPGSVKAEVRRGLVALCAAWLETADLSRPRDRPSHAGMRDCVPNAGRQQAIP